MSVINLLWKTIVLFICSIIQVIGVVVEGIAKILFAITKILEKAHDKVLGCANIKKKNKKVHINVPL